MIRSQTRAGFLAVVEDKATPAKIAKGIELNNPIIVLSRSLRLPNPILRQQQNLCKFFEGALTFS